MDISWTYRKTYKFKVKHSRSKYIIKFLRGYVAVVTDIIAMAFCPYLALIKFMGKTAAKKLVSKYLPKIAGVFK